MGGLFKSSTPKPTVTAMPDDNDPSVLEAKRRAAAAVTARSGRASTVMTQRQQATASQGTSTPATGGAYKNSFLGSAN